MSEPSCQLGGHVPVIDISQDDSMASQQLFDALITSGFACLTSRSWPFYRLVNWFIKM